MLFKDKYNLIPESFFERNEADFRCALVRGSTQPEVDKAFAAVDSAATELCESIKADFCGDKDCKVSFDIFNNILLLTNKNKSWNPGPSYKIATDRFGKTISRRWTTQRVELSTQRYVEATQAATSVVSAVLHQLSDDVAKLLIPIVQATHYNVILQAAALHVTASKRKGWCSPTVSFSPSDSNLKNAFHAKDMTPYWIDRQTATKNNVSMHGLTLLTVIYINFIFILLILFLINVKKQPSLCRPQT